MLKDGLGKLSPVLLPCGSMYVPVIETHLFFLSTCSELEMSDNGMPRDDSL